ncbi:MAG: cupredoxin domain-containing protein [Solirubrobacterales bacterium]
MVAVVAAVCLAVPAGAGADERVIAGPAPSTYLNPEVELDAGEPLSFLNADLGAAHDVTSVDVAGAKALFASETVGPGTEVPVVGAESLAPGTYDYLCSVHTFMEGTLAVRGSGPPDQDADKKAPRLSVRVLDERIREVLHAGGLTLRAKLDEPATLRVRASAGRRDVKVASGGAKLDSGASRIVAQLTPRGKRALKKADRVRLKLSARAEDAAGNSRKQSASVTLR